MTLHRNAFTGSFRHLSHTQVSERFGVVGLEEEPVARDHNPRSEEGAFTQVSDDQATKESSSGFQSFHLPQMDLEDG